MDTNSAKRSPLCNKNSLSPVSHKTFLIFFWDCTSISFNIHTSRQSIPDSLELVRCCSFSLSCFSLPLDSLLANSCISIFLQTLFPDCLGLLRHAPQSSSILGLSPTFRASCTFLRFVTTDPYFQILDSVLVFKMSLYTTVLKTGKLRTTYQHVVC